MSKKTSNKKAEAQALVVEEVGSIHKIKEKHGLSQVYVIGKTEGQKKAIHTVLEHDITFLSGMAGTGKTFIATGIGLNMILQGKYDRLILSRPYVEAGESLGYLPGSFSNKLAPYMFPLMDICTQLIGSAATMELIEKGHIAVMPMAYMRGISLHNAFVILDESQNSSISQMRMMLTRIGEKCKLVVTGDSEQSDLHPKDGKTNGLVDAIKRLQSVEEIGFHEMSENDCVRSAIVAKIDKLYRSGN